MIRRLDNPELRVGIQGGVNGSFHSIAAEEYGFKPEQLVPFDNHHDLVAAMRRNSRDTQDPDSVDVVVSAVDNTDSGRVTSAIGALAHYGEYHIVGLHDLNVPQYGLIHPDIPVQNITHVMSQEPALIQCANTIEAAGYIRVPEDDTLKSAMMVAENDGIINGHPTMALASYQAGEFARLVPIRIMSDNPASMTRFWVLSTEQDWDEVGNHAAFTFEVPDRKESLCDAVTIISDDGYDFTDIDSHLNPARRGNRAFFAEVKRGNGGNDVKGLIKKLRSIGYPSKLLGIYDSDGPLTIKGGLGGVPSAVSHELWRSTEGLDIADGSPVVYISARNQPKSLKGMLQILKKTNLQDMSRPISGRGEHRGFYFVLDRNTHPAMTKNIIDRLRDDQYEAVELEHKNGSLHS